MERITGVKKALARRVPLGAARARPACPIFKQETVQGEN
jgi:hypothetical protein